MGAALEAMTIDIEPAPSDCVTLLVKALVRTQISPVLAPSPFVMASYRVQECFYSSFRFRVPVKEGFVVPIESSPKGRRLPPCNAFKNETLVDSRFRQHLPLNTLHDGS